MNIFILAGGYGTRLQSVVSNVPKPMADINGNPFLHYQIIEIRKYFKNEPIYILTHYLSEIIEEYFKDDDSITIIKEQEALGTGGSIKHAIKSLNLATTNSILVLNGDTYIKPNFGNFIKSSSENITILGSFQQNCDRYGVLKLEDNRIIDFLEKNTEAFDSYINAGCYLFQELSFFDNIIEDKFSIEDKFRTYLSSVSINIFKYDGVFIDIGIPEDYERMKRVINKNEK